MRIFLIVVYYLPSTKSSAKLIGDLAIELKANGHDVTVITQNEFIDKSCKVEVEEGITVVRIKAGKIDKAGKIVRAINETLLSWRIWRKAKPFFKKSHCDLVVWYSPSIFFGNLVNKIRKKYDAASYLILRDIFPQWALDTGLLKKGLVYSFFKRYELEQYAAADIIGVQSPGNLDYFERIENHNYKLEVLYNWTKTIEINVPKTNYREQLKLQGKLVFFYGGNIGTAQDLDNVIRLAETLRNEQSAYFLIVGDGSESQRLKGLIFAKGLTNISIHESVNQGQYLGMLSEFDIGLVSLERKFQTPNFPGKMLGYMYFSMPILASINEGNDLKDVLEKFDAGLVSINGSNEIFAKNAKEMIYNQEHRLTMGSNARKLLEMKFSVKNAANQIMSHFS